MYYNRNYNAYYRPPMNTHRMMSEPVSYMKEEIDREIEKEDDRLEAPVRKEHLAMAYVPWQKFDSVYPLMTGYKEGTMFPDLKFEFCGVRGHR